ncbi:type VII secretion-associated serine protease mycosin [Kitasatospora sp. NPDC057223]|uniref:type VII secretion-associated serine protease mycosin n=1 Tax=Kitasatospora sp. NPDC057223 TaxID=3346055 RepID=UPI0036269124
MTTSRPVRGAAVLAAGTLLWGMAAGPATADTIRDGQWALVKYDAETKVWPVSQGEGVIVAVIDTGVAADHQDLTGQVLPGFDRTGEAGEGRVDKDGHGTGMASLIAGHGHGDQAGVMGLAPKAKILPARVPLSGVDNSRAAEGDAIPLAIRFAVDHGAKVINMSFSGAGDSETRDAVNYALSKDVVLVGGTGNAGNHETSVTYPAAFPGVIAVGAVDQDGKIWAKSSPGPETTVVAPGVGIYSAGSKSTSAYRTADGTSDATAYVSAIAALVRSKYPSLSAGQVINRIIKSAVAPPDGTPVPDDHYGNGIASPSKALAANPEVDNGPKGNPLLTRTEPHPPSSPEPVPTGDGKQPGAKVVGDGLGKTDSSGVPVYVYVLAGALGLLVIVLIVFLVVRSRKNGSGGPPPPPPGAGGHLPPGPPQQPYGQPQNPQYGQPQYGQSPYGAAPQQQSPYGYPPASQAPQPPQGPPGGNPFR